MNTGDKIKFRLRNDETWKTGVFISQNSMDYAEIQYNGQNLTVPLVHVKKFIQVSDEQIEQFAKENLQPLYDFLQKTLKAIFPQFENKVEIKENCLSIRDGQITIDPATMEVNQIGAIKEVPGWVVSVWCEIPESRYEPANIFDTEIGTARTNKQAVYLAVDTLYKCIANEYWDTFEEEEFCKQQQEYDDFEV